MTIDDLDEAKLRLLRPALNRLGEESSWDVDALTVEFSDILDIDVDIDLQISGFEMGEIDGAFARTENDEEGDLPTHGNRRCEWRLSVSKPPKALW